MKVEYNKLFHQYLFWVVFSVAKNDFDAEEVVQDAFNKLFELFHDLFNSILMNRKSHHL